MIHLPTRRKLVAGALSITFLAGVLTLPAATKAEAATSAAVTGVASAKCLDIARSSLTPGTPTIISTCTGQSSQRWSLPTTGDLRMFDGTRCLQAVGNLTAPGTRAVTALCTGQGGQKWRYTAGKTLVHQRSGLCLDVRDAQTAAGSEVRLQTCTGATNQQWQIPPGAVSDTQVPTAPTNVTAVASGTSVTVRWAAATDNVGVTRYEIRRNGEAAGAVTATFLQFTDLGLAANQSFSYTVTAKDAAGNASPRSATTSVTTGSGCASPVCGATEIAAETDLPWGLATLPDGSVLYSRRDARDIVRMNPATGAKTTVGSIPSAANSDGGGGLMGIAVAADFATDPWLYIMHTTQADNRIVRMRYANGMLDGSSTQVLLAGILRSEYHNGGRLRFGPDGMLYATTGDAEKPEYAQRLTGIGALNGKVLRLTRTGGVPADNPFGSHIWSYGHRNHQGLAFDSRGRLWQQEFGDNVMDETNLIRRGGNYGWPQCEGTYSASGSGCSGPGLIAPVRTVATSEGSCSGLAIVRDVVYAACQRGTRLYRGVISGDSLIDVRQFFVGVYGRLKTVEPSADGGLWLTTTNYDGKDSIANNSNERILKVTLAG